MTERTYEKCPACGGPVEWKPIHVTRIYDVGQPPTADAESYLTHNMHDFSL
ncbi:MAG: hypothetical protein ABSF00_12185 [Candidatus Bathyarchaeia archaeon]